MISVIIPTITGGFTHLAKLMPLLSQEPNKEIIVVDNNSMDGTTHYLANYECKIIVNKTRKSFSISNNQGASIAKGDKYLFLNNDTLITPGLLKEMEETMQVSDAKIVGTLIYSMGQPQRIQHAGVCFTVDYLPYELGFNIPGISSGISESDPRVKTRREIPSTTAACFMIDATLFKKLNGFDETYINGWEDTDLCLRARELGEKIWYTGRTHIYHFHMGSKSQGRLSFENQNRQLYDAIWVHSGRAKKILGEFREN